MVAFYQALSDRADARERRARWIIERYELSNKRAEFLSRDKLEVEEDMRSAALEIERKNAVQSVNKARRDSNVDGFDEVDDATKSIKDDLSHNNVQDVIETSVTDGQNLDDAIPPNLMPVDLQQHTESQESDQDISEIDSSSSNPTLIMSDSRRSSHGSSQTTPLVNRSDQNISIAKDILYPTTTPTSDSSVINLPTKTSDQSISNAKDILYPTTFEADLVMTSSYQHQFENDADSRIDSKREPLGNSAFEGSGTRDLMYPSQVSEDVALEASTPVHPIEGSLTKDLLYPGDIIASFTANHEQAQKQAEEGAETKGLLYPSTNESLDSGHVVEGKYSTDGEQTKSLLYNTNDGEQEPQVEFYSRGNMKVDSGKQTKDILYPTTIDQEDNKPYEGHQSGMYAEGKETKNLLYPEVQKDKQNIDEAYELLSTHRNNSYTKSSQEVVSEGSNTETMLYPNEASQPMANAESGQVRQFEKPSTMQHLLYPDTLDYDNDDDGDVTRNIRRGFEPPTTITNLMYPVQPSDAGFLTFFAFLCDQLVNLLWFRLTRGHAQQY